MPGEEGWISGQVPLCLLNHHRFLVPWVGLYKVQTAAGFSMLLPWNWVITKPDRGFRHHQLASRGDPLSQVTDHLMSFTSCCGVTQADHRVIGRGGTTRLDTWYSSNPTFAVLCQGWQRSRDPCSPVRPQDTLHSCARVPSLSQVCPLLF